MNNLSNEENVRNAIDVIYEGKKFFISLIKIFSNMALLLCVVPIIYFMLSSGCINSLMHQIC